MSWTNYHSHTHYCDGKGRVEEYIETAIEKDFKAYGISGHSPVPFASSWNMKKAEMTAYLLEIQEAKDRFGEKIQIYTGLEVDFIPDKVGPNHPDIKQYGLDYTIGSVHFIDAFDNGEPWEIDGLHTVFDRGLSEIFGNEIEPVIQRYYELTRQMVASDCPHVVGHLDKIKIQNPGNKYFDESAEWYRKEIFKTLDLVAESNVIVEVNTRGAYKNVAALYPSEWIISEMRDREIPIMLNSDSHHIREIDGAFIEAARATEAAGYTELHVLYDKVWQPVTFSEEGLIW